MKTVTNGYRIHIIYDSPEEKQVAAEKIIREKRERHEDNYARQLYEEDERRYAMQEHEQEEEE